LGPSIAVQAGGGWCLPGETNYHDSDYPDVVYSGSNITVQFTTIPGYASPTNNHITLVPGFQTHVMNYIPTNLQITLSAWPTNGGTATVNGGSGSGLYPTGGTNTVTATANNDFVFTNWTYNSPGGTVASSSNPLSFELTSNVTLVAHFLPLYTITVMASPSNGGIVTGNATNIAGSSNTVTATANAGFVFSEWEINGQFASGMSNYTVILETNVFWTAVFLTNTSTNLPQIQVWNGPTIIANRQTNAVDFGSALQNQTGPIFLFTITNTGMGTLVLSNNTTLGLPAGFVLVTNPPAAIAGGSSGGFAVQLLSADAGLQAGEISITNNDPNNNPFIFSITGFVLTKIISSSDSLDFGVVPTDASSNLTLTISNLGNTNLTVSNISLPFLIFSNGWPSGPPLSIAPSSSQQVTVTFAPAIPTNYSGVMTVESDATSGSSNLFVTAFGANDSLLLTIITNGYGKVKPNDAKVIKFNTKVSLTAVPDTTNVFVNWTGSFNSTNNPLVFRMHSDMIVEANFTNNPFLPYLGTYNGLFWSSNGLAETNAGMLKGLTLTKKGTYSGALLLNGEKKSLSGSFNLTLQATNKPINFGGTEGMVGLIIELTNEAAPQIIGTISNANWVATNLMADRAATNTTISRAYTLIILPDASLTAAPSGNGYATISTTAGNSKTATSAEISGSLADGQMFSQSTFVSREGYVPIYAAPYNGKGLLMGWINLSLGSAPGAQLYWVHPPIAGKSVLFPASFVSTNEVEFAPWNNLELIAFLGSLTNLEEIIGTNVLTNIVDINAATEKESKSGLSVTITPATGQFKIRIGSGTDKVTGQGAILLNGTNTEGYGYFLGKTNAGAIQLGP